MEGNSAAPPGMGARPGGRASDSRGRDATSALPDVSCPHHQPPPPAVWDELRRVTMSALPLGYALEGLRLLPARLAGRGHQPLSERTFLDVTPIPALFCRPRQVVISAGLSQAWRLWAGQHRRAWMPRACAHGRDLGGSRSPWSSASTDFGGHPAEHETRVAATDRRTRRVFAVYWFFSLTGSGAIRREVLRSSQTVRSRRAPARRNDARTRQPPLGSVKSAAHQSPAPDESPPGPARAADRDRPSPPAPDPGVGARGLDWRIRYQLSNLRRLHEGAVVISSPKRALRERMTTNPDRARPDTSFCPGLVMLRCATQIAFPLRMRCCRRGRRSRR